MNVSVVAISVDSQFTHLGTDDMSCFKCSITYFIVLCFSISAWINTPREQGGLGKIQIPLLSDLTHQISKDYGVLFTRCRSCIEVTIQR